jgi:hypothetical protein
LGKYDALVPNLPKLAPEDQGYQEKVNAVKDATRYRNDATRLADNYARLRLGDGPQPGSLETDQLVARLGKRGIEALLYACNLRIAAHEQMLADSQSARADGWGKYGVKDNALRLSDGTTIRIDREPYGKVIDREAFRKWCIVNGYETKLQLWPSTMNAIVKERLLAGEPEPDGTEAYSMDKVVFVPAKGE